MDLNKIQENVAALTTKKNNILLESGDHCLREAYRQLSKMYKKIYIPDEGGWLKYRTDPLKYGLEIIEYKTESGAFLEFEIEPNSILLVNSSPGYFFIESMKGILEFAKKNNCILLNDASGSIGTDEATYGDIIVFSTGKDKIINNHYGGFICFDDVEYMEIIKPSFDEKEIEYLNFHIENVQKRIYDLREARSELIQSFENDLKMSRFSDHILFKGSKGINFFMRLDEYEMKEVKKMLAKGWPEYQYTICPRYIRLNENGLSFEIKRIP